MVEKVALVVLSLIALTGTIYADSRVVCYYGSWANYRPGDGAFKVEDVDPFLCTHFIYTFAGLDESTNTIKSLDPYLDLPDNYGLDAYGRSVALKDTNPDLKVMLACGGWNEGSIKYSNMAGDPNSRATFVQSVVDFMNIYGFDGFDLDWEYPNGRGGVPADKQNFILLLQELQTSLHANNKILSVAVGMGIDKYEAGYDAKQISDSVDMINMMTYDFRGNWDGVTGHHTQQYQGPDDTGNFAYYNLDLAVQNWLDNGADPLKCNLGMAMYAQTFTVNSGNGPLGVPSDGPGTAGPYTRQPGFIGYNELCLDLNSQVWNIESNDYVISPWAWRDNQWFCFDNVTSIQYKSQWALDRGLGGGMIWSIETDDFHGNCGSGVYPLLNTINAVMRNGVLPPTPDPNRTTTTTTTTTKAPYTGPPTTSGSLTCVVGSQKDDPNDCSMYYVCGPSVDGMGEWVHESCPATLYYDLRGYCDYEANVDCGTRPKN